jgi:hypothetical protein
VDGCEILHQLIGGLHHFTSLFTGFQPFKVVQDFATIHSIKLGVRKLTSSIIIFQKCWVFMAFLWVFMGFHRVFMVFYVRYRCSPMDSAYGFVASQVMAWGPTWTSNGSSRALEPERRPSYRRSHWNDPIK